MNPWEWSSADILTGKMFVGGIPLAKFCPNCHSMNVSGYDAFGNQKLHCHDCGMKFGGASARA